MIFSLFLSAQETDPVFIARDFVVRFLRDEIPLDLPPTKTPNNSFHSDEETSKETQIKFTVGCGNITQRVNLPFVRLTLQVIDMLDLLSDYISNTNENETHSPSHDPSPMSHEDKTDGVRPSRNKFPHGHVKCWRIMYQVVDLYSSLPREAKNKGFMRRSTIGRVLGGKMKTVNLFTGYLYPCLVNQSYCRGFFYMAFCHLKRLGRFMDGILALAGLFPVFFPGTESAIINRGKCRFS